MTETSVNLALSVWIRMLKVHNLVFREARTRMASYCTMAQFDVLAQLAREQNGTTSAELSRRLLVTAGNLTGLLDRMEKASLIFRKPDSKDRRVVWIHLTDKGNELAAKIIPLHSKDISEIIGGLDVTELKSLRRLLDKLVDGIGPEKKKAKS